MKNKVLISLNFSIFFLFAAFLNAQKPTCDVKISSPVTGSQTGGEGLVSGTATLPPNGHLWVLAHKVGVAKWWPQGSGEAAILGNDWDVRVYYGIKGDYGQFDVVALVVDKQAHTELEKWVKAGNWSDPIALPTIIDGCPVAKVRVDKTKD